MKKQLITIMTLIGLIPLLIYAGITLPLANTTMERDAYHINENHLEQVQQKVNSTILQVADVLKVLSYNPFISGYKPSSEQQAKELLETASNAHPEIESLILVSAEGDQLVKNSNTALNNVKDRDYFKMVTDTGKLAVSDVLISRTTNKPSIVVAYPIAASGGSVQGLLTATIELERVVDFVKEFTENSQFAFIADRKGLVVVHNDPAKLQSDVTQAPYYKALKQGETDTDAYKDESGKRVAISSLLDPLTGWAMFLQEDEAVILKDSKSMFNIGIIVLLGSLIMTVGAGYYFSVRTTRPILRLVESTRKIAEGDLTEPVRVEAKHEIGVLADSLYQMARDLQSLIIQVKDTSLLLASSSQELTASAEQTSQAAENIATSIQQVSEASDRQSQEIGGSINTVGEMVDGVSHIADNASQVAETSQLAKENTEQGEQAIITAVEGINRLGSVFEGLSSSVRSLDEHSQNIGAIVQVIADISNQTNLLALNAGIEAARAGEQGRGFAVVANEVKKLASQSRESALQIKEVIAVIQNEIASVVEKTAAGGRDVENGIGNVHTARQSFGRIHSLVEQAASQIQEVSASAAQLMAGASGVATAMEQVSTITENTFTEIHTVSAGAEEQLATMEEIASSSATLSGLAQELQKAVDRFKV